MDDLTKLSKEELVREHGARVGAFIKIDASSHQAIELSNKYGESRDELLRRLTPQPTGDHPEDNCQKCSHRMRLNYAADSDTWNKVVGDAWSIICVDCFIELCQKAGVEPKFVVFHIPGSEFYHEVIPQPVGEIGELLDRIHDEGYDYDRDKDWQALRTAVASLQDELDAEKRTCLEFVGTCGELGKTVTRLRGLIGELVDKKILNDMVWGEEAFCRFCGSIRDDFRQYIPDGDDTNDCFNPDCPAVRARAELEAQNG